MQGLRSVLNKSTYLSVAHISLATIALLLVVWSSAFARIVRVPQDVPTVQAGLDSLRAGDTLSVEPATYSEHLVAPSLRMSMLGVVDPDGDPPLPVIDASDLQLEDTTAVLRLSRHSQVTIENIEFRNRGRLGIRSWADSVLLKNCSLDSMYEALQQVQDSIGACVTLENVTMRKALFRCVGVFNGNTLRARHCQFSGSGDNLYYLVGAINLEIDSCSFNSEFPAILLVGSAGNHRISGSVFGPSETPEFNRAIQLHGRRIVFVGNTVQQCYYGSHAVEVASELGDSVEIRDNVFEACVSRGDGMAGQGALSVSSNSDAVRGPLVAQNLFIECSGSFFADDLSLDPFAPYLILGNHFNRDSLNGLPSIGMSSSPWQPTPAVLRGNVFEECGYAVTGTGSADARWNYWGDPSGPYHATLNPQGLGDTLTGDVQFIPWLEDTLPSANDARVEFPDELSLSVHPNPFNPSTTISFALAHSSRVSLAVFDLLGREVEQLAAGNYPAGKHSVEFDGTSLTSGTYFARLTTPNHSAAAKLLLLK